MTADRNNFKASRALKLGAALKLVWHSSPGLTVASVVLLFAEGVLPLAAIYLIKLIVDAVDTGASAADSRAAFSEVAVLVAIAASVALAAALARALSRLVSDAQADALADYMFAVIHAKSIEVDFEYYEDARYFDTLHRAQHEAPYRPVRILNGLVELARSGVSLAAMAVLLFTFHWGIALVLFAAAFPGLFVRVLFARKLFAWHRDRTSDERWSSYYHWLLTGDAHAKEVRLFDLGALFTGRFNDIRKRLRTEKLALSAKRSGAEFAAQVFAIAGVFASYAFIAYRGVHGAISLGDLIMYFSAFRLGQEYFRSALSGLAGLYEDNLYLANLFEFLTLKRKVAEPSKPQGVPKPIAKGVTFDRVSFRYPNGKRKVIEDISLEIAPGEKIALVGENGTGKTTIIKLLCRLYDPASGSIKIDGIDLRNFGTTALRREISPIFQDFARYNLSAGENIRLGDPGVISGGEAVERAAKNAGAHGVIASLERGYDTTLGKMFEDGEELSAGEWQKLALARAFLKNAQIFVLDEPTAALDAKAEAEIAEKFAELAEGKSAILVSHRFSTIRMANRIYVLEDGTIAESGTHEELVARGGAYARLYHAGAQFYR